MAPASERRSFGPLRKVVHLDSHVPQVLQHVMDVIVEDKLQRQGRRISDGQRPRPGCIRNRFGSGQQLPVERRPAFDQRLPVAPLILMQCHPGVAIVAGHGRMLFQLRANDTLVVVGGGVQQVSQFFLRRPRIRRRVVFDSLGRKGPQADRQTVDQLLQDLQTLHFQHPTMSFYYAPASPSNPQLQTV
jgi:hypothetical protein